MHETEMQLGMATVESIVLFSRELAEHGVLWQRALPLVVFNRFPEMSQRFLHFEFLIRPRGIRELDRT